MDTDRRFLLLLIGLAAVLTFLVLLPYLQYVLAAVLFVYVLRPLQRRLAPRVGPRISAGALISIATVAILLPFAVLLGVAAGQAASLLRAIRDGSLGVGVVERFLRTTVGISVDLGALIEGIDLPALLRSLGNGGSSSVVGNLVSLLGGFTDLLIGVTIMLFVLYYSLTDGARFVAWLKRVTPLPADVQDELAAELDQMLFAVLVGNVLVGVVQGVLTGIGFLVVGISNVVFWTVMTTILALLPLIGASIVWVPASIYLLATGRPVAGAGLFIYGAAVVSISDNYLRPLFVDREARLNAAVVVVGIFGGIAFLGVMGLFFGPVILGVAKTLVEVYNRGYVDAGFGDHPP